MHQLLILTPQPDEYRERIEAAELPDLSIVASSDVGDGLARGAHSDLLRGDPARVREALPHLPRLTWTQLTWAGVEPMIAPSGSARIVEISVAVLVPTPMCAVRVAAFAVVNATTEPPPLPSGMNV